MVRKVILSVVVGVVVSLVCLLLGSLMGSISVEWAAKVGKFLESYSGLIGLLAAIWYFFASPPVTPNA